MYLKYIVKDSDINKSIKELIYREFAISNRLFSRLKNNGNILINRNRAMVNDKPSEGDVIDVNLDLDLSIEDNIVPQDGNLDIIYEDDFLIAVNKPANMVVHLCSYHPDKTLSNYIKFYLASKGNNTRIHPINRLDNGTSGIVLFAKNEYVQERYKVLNKTINKEYLAIVVGKFNQKAGKIEAPISRKEGSIIERRVNPENGQQAITYYEVIKEFKYDYIDVSLLRIRIETGRTHQIRVHMAYIDHPIVGDTLYNKLYDFPETSHQLLHAETLKFIHPISKELITINANLPSEFTNIL